MEMLRSAPVGSKLSIAIIGSTDEIRGFAHQVIDLFTTASWRLVDMRTFRDEFSSRIVDGSGSSAITHGEGVNCFNDTIGVAEIRASDALTTAGFPCGDKYPFPAVVRQANHWAVADFYISIGTRIHGK
jgi:hypothetical protein